MRIRKIIVPIACLLFIASQAQRLILFGGEPKLFMSPFSLIDSCVMDTANMTVTYRYFDQDSNNPDHWATIRMQVGRKVVKQTDLHLYFNNLTYDKILKDFSAVSLPQKREQTHAEALKAAGGNTNLFFEMIHHMDENTIQVIISDFFDADSPNAYIQTLQPINWMQTGQIDTVAGYACRVAMSDFKGRQWKAWYTTEIPLRTGPWKLGQLPGLILRAEELSGKFRFECCGIESSERPMYEYAYKSLRDFKTADRYLRYERNCHERPLETFAQGQEAIVMARGADGKSIQLDESWTLPYDPIERE